MLCRLTNPLPVWFLRLLFVSMELQAMTLFIDNVTMQNCFLYILVIIQFSHAQGCVHCHGFPSSNRWVAQISLFQSYCFAMCSTVASFWRVTFNSACGLSTLDVAPFVWYQLLHGLQHLISTYAVKCIPKVQLKEYFIWSKQGSLIKLKTKLLLIFETNLVVIWWWVLLTPPLPPCHIDKHWTNSTNQILFHIQQLLHKSFCSCTQTWTIQFCYCTGPNPPF